MVDRLRIGIDLDGVLADFNSAFWKIVARQTGLDVAGFHPEAWFGKPPGISDADVDRAWKEIKDTPNWWLGLRKLPGTSLLPDLYEKCRCYFITHRIQDGRGLPIDQQSALWLTTAFGLKAPTVLDEKDKLSIVKVLKLNAFIDDKPETVREILLGSTVWVGMPHYSYNSDANLNMARVANFNEFARRILGKSV